MKKLLHISHHIGCMRDHAYIYDKLNFEYEFWKFPKGVFKITKDLATSFWNEKKTYFNSFDFIVTSDTAPLSRIFMENIHQLKPTVIVWICNRFDYNMEFDVSFYDLFKRIAINNKDKFKIIPYSDFEGIWCKYKGIENIMQTITPIGKQLKELDYKIDCLKELNNNYINDSNSKNHYSNAEVELKNKMFIPIYGNDNHFFNLKELFEKNNIDYFNGGYSHPTDLIHCKALITFPDAFSKLITFETIQNNIIVFLPSEEFIIRLHRSRNNGVNYWFNSPFGLNETLVKTCEWYRYKECRIYFDSIEDMLYKIKNLNEETVKDKYKWCDFYGRQLEEQNTTMWKNILN